MSDQSNPPRVAIVGGGPAGLMAAETLASCGVGIDLYDAMPSVGRKFLMAGKSGLNLTHAEPFDRLLDRFGAARERLAPILAAFAPVALRDWAADLGIATFVGSSGRVFPEELKAAPLLRAWLRRLRGAGIRFHMRHRWCGWDGDGALRFATPTGGVAVCAEATVLALGGASWPRLGSDGAWVPWLRQRGVEVDELRPANCGFDVAWSPHFRERFAGAPVKSVVLSAAGVRLRGDFVITESGIEGGAVYAHAAALRDAIAASGEAILTIDLAPDRPPGRLAHDLARPRGSHSTATHWRRAAGIAGVKAGLLHEHLLREHLPRDGLAHAVKLAAAIKALPLRLVAPRPLAEAISSAGGVAFAALDERLMLHQLPGVFCAGEMVDWEVATGGYLLSACFAMGRAAGSGAAEWLRRGH